VNIDSETAALAIKDGVKEAFSQAAYLAALKEKPFLTGKEVEALYGIPAASLKAWRRSHKGPRCLQREKGEKARYTHLAIIEFMECGNAGNTGGDV